MRIDYYPISSMDEAAAKAIEYIEQQRAAVEEAKQSGKELKKYTGLDRVWFTPDERTAWVISIDDKQKYAVDSYIPMIDLTINGKSIYDGMSEEAKKRIPQEMFLGKYQLNRNVVKEIFDATKCKINTRIEKVYQVF